MLKYPIIVLLIFSTFIFVSAQDFPKYNDRYVNDFAGILDDLQKQEIRDLFMQVETQTTAQEVFVSMETIGNYDISQYATELGQSWEVGMKDKDNGLLILYVKDINKIYVASGYGIEGILPDSKIGRILDESYVSLRDEGRVNEGIVLASKELSQVIIDNKEEVLSGKTSPEDENLSIFFIVAVVMLIIVIYSLSSRARYGGLLIGGSSGGFRSGGGMSGGGFGGGSFGGGGAGR